MIVYAIVLVLLFIFVYPIYFTIIASFSEPVDVVKGDVLLWVKGFTLDSYKQILEEKQLWTGYRNTAVYTVCGTVLHLLFTIPTAYAMSKKKMWKRSWISVFFIIPMYIGGGMLPTYLQIKNLGLVNQWFTQIVLGVFSIYNMIVARNYFQSSIPEELYESAEIDGASHFKQFFRIGIPLAKPIIAVITLYSAVGLWNNYWDSLIYITNSKYFSLQFVLRTILLSATNIGGISEMAAVESVEHMEYILRRAYMAESMKYSVILVASLPMLILYPFVQKYFVKGIMVGSLKG